MLNTFIKKGTGLLLTTVTCLLSTNVSAQSIIFSSDQWPKRWERAMKNVSQAGHGRYERATHQRNGAIKVSNQQSGWGKQPDRIQHKHERSLTPEYHNYANQTADDLLKQRYALPGVTPSTYGYLPYQGNYYGLGVPMVPHLPATVYPSTIYGGGYPGYYPGIYPGWGAPGIYTAPGLYPYGGFPGSGLFW